MTNKIIATLLSAATIFFLMISPIIIVAFSPSFYKPFYSDNFKTNATDQEFLTTLVLDYVRGIDVAMIPFSPNAISHLDDVHSLVNIAEILLISSVIILLLLVPFIWWYKKDYQLVLRPLFISSIIALCFTLLSAVLAKLNFSGWFIKFHEIFFRHGNWQFADNDLLILLFPMGIFQVLVLKIMMMSIGLSGLFVLLSYLLLYKFNKK